MPLKVEIVLLNLIVMILLKKPTATFITVLVLKSISLQIVSPLIDRPHRTIRKLAHHFANDEDGLIAYALALHRRYLKVLNLYLL